MSDVAIIGAGPVGIFSVFACGQLGLKCEVFDSLEECGGQCAALYPQKPIYDIPAYTEISGEQLVQQLVQQAEPFNPKYHLGKTIEDLTKSDDDFLVAGHKFKAVIIAGGIGRFAPNKPPLEGIAEFEEKSLFYQVSKPKEFADDEVIIFGGTKKLYLVHRRPKFRAVPSSVAELERLMAQGKITPLIGYQPSGLSGSKGKLESVTLSPIGGGEARIVAVQKMLVFYGLKNDTELFNRWGLNIEDGGFAVDQMMQTNQQGIYAVGDAARYKAKLKLILSGFSEAAIAAETAYKHIHGTAPRFQYSTSKGKPGTEK